MSNLPTAPSRSSDARSRVGSLSGRLGACSLALSLAALGLASLGSETWVAAGYRAPAAAAGLAAERTLDHVAFDAGAADRLWLSQGLLHGATGLAPDGVAGLAAAELVPGARIAVGPAGAAMNYRVVSAMALPAAVAAALGADRPMVVVTARDPTSGRTVRLLLEPGDTAARPGQLAAPKDL